MQGADGLLLQTAAAGLTSDAELQLSDDACGCWIFGCCLLLQTAAPGLTSDAELQLPHHACGCWIFGCWTGCFAAASFSVASVCATNGPRMARPCALEIACRRHAEAEPLIGRHAAFLRRAFELHADMLYSPDANLTRATTRALRTDHTGNGDQRQEALASPAEVPWLPHRPLGMHSESDRVKSRRRVLLVAEHLQD